jgi:hypothetical protein
MVDIQLRRGFPGLKGGAVGNRCCATFSGYLCEWVIGRRPLCKWWVAVKVGCLDLHLHMPP